MIISNNRMECAVCGCKNDNKPKKDRKVNIRFYSFPMDPVLREKWVQFCKRKEKFNPGTSWVCSEHFTPNDIQRNLKYEMGFSKRNPCLLKPDSVPTVYQPTTDNTLENYNSKLLELKIIRVEGNYIENDNTDYLISSTEHEASAEIFDTQTPQTEKLNVNTKAKSKDTEKVRSAHMRQLQIENYQLKSNEAKLKKTISVLHTQLTKSDYENKNLETKLKTIFTSTQIKKLKSGRRVYWSEVDMTKCFKLYNAGSRAYKMLVRENFPLPSVRCLQTWVQRENKKGVGIMPEKAFKTKKENVSDLNLDTEPDKIEYLDHSYCISSQDDGISESDS